MDPAVTAATTAVVGWIAVHFLTIRAQKKHFINQIKNDARKEINSALRDYGDWCSTVAARLGGLRNAFLDGVPPWSEARWLEAHREINELAWGKPTIQWLLALEENEILFPELRRPRQQLGDWHLEISKHLGEFLLTLLTPTNRKQGVEAVQKVVTQIREQHALVHYVLVYLQNIALGAIVGRKQPVPAPRDVTLVRLVARGKKLEFGLGEPVGRAAFAWRRFWHGRFRAILDDNLPAQQALFEQMTRIAGCDSLPVSDWWMQGEGKRMGVQILDARTSRGLWLETGTPEEILALFATWVAPRELQPSPLPPSKERPPSEAGGDSAPKAPAPPDQA